MSIEELKLDLEELNKFLVETERESVKNILNENIKNIQKKISQLELQEKKQQERKLKQEQQNQQPKQLQQKTITNYSFDQEGSKVKVYIFLDNVGDIPRENITHTFSLQSVEVHINGYQKQNLLFKIPQLCSKINVDSSKLIVKQNRVTLILAKKETGHWDQLAYKENKVAKGMDKDLDSSDPNASLMGLMKKMYDEGDDEMKRTLNKAWTESQDKKNKGEL